MRSGVVMKDCAKLTHILSPMVGWCRKCVAVSLRKTVQSLPVCF